MPEHPFCIFLRVISSPSQHYLGVLVIMGEKEGKIEKYKSTVYLLSLIMLQDNIERYESYNVKKNFSYIWLELFLGHPSIELFSFIDWMIMI